MLKIDVPNQIRTQEFLIKTDFPKIFVRQKHIQVGDSKKTQSGKFLILADYTSNILAFEVET